MAILILARLISRGWAAFPPHMLVMCILSEDRITLHNVAPLGSLDCIDQREHTEVFDMTYLHPPHDFSAHPFSILPDYPFCYGEKTEWSVVHVRCIVQMVE